jgi:hypothetical protein
MLDLRMVLWFIMGASFLLWALLLIGRHKAYLKTWLISFAVWLFILILQVSTKNIIMPYWTIYQPIQGLNSATQSLYMWFPSLLAVLIPIGVYRIYKDAKNKRITKTESEK